MTEALVVRLLTADELADAKAKADLALASDKASWHTKKAAEITLAFLGHIAAMDARVNTPQMADFIGALPAEAAHQRERWGYEHDAGKAPEDWFWLLGWLSGKAVHAVKSGDIEKAKHHTISSAAALANWHAALSGDTAMRPGIDPAERGLT